MKQPKDLWLRGPKSLAIRVVRANHFFLRLRGLLGRLSLPSNEGLLLEPCSAVHMLGMKFPIDIIFLSKTDQVQAVFAHVPPGWRGYSFPGSYKALELAAGAAEQLSIAPGEQLIFQHSNETI